MVNVFLLGMSVTARRNAPVSMTQNIVTMKNTVTGASARVEGNVLLMGSVTARRKRPVSIIII